MPKQFAEGGHLDPHFVRRVRNEVDIHAALVRALCPLRMLCTLCLLRLSLCLTECCLGCPLPLGTSVHATRCTEQLYAAAFRFVGSLWHCMLGRLAGNCPAMPCPPLLAHPATRWLPPPHLLAHSWLSLPCACAAGPLPQRVHALQVL